MVKLIKLFTILCMCLPTHLRKAHAKPHSQRPQSNMSYKAGQVMKIMIFAHQEGLLDLSAVFSRANRAALKKAQVSPR